MRNEVFFDIESKFLFDEVGNDFSKLGASIVSVYSRTIDDAGNEVDRKLESFWEKDLEGLWPLFTKADRIVGFNSLHFDVPVLQPYAFTNLSMLPHFDMLDHIKERHGFRVSLNKLATASLGESKNDEALNAVVYLRNGDAESLAKLKAYCEQDVLLTKKLYDHGVKHKQLHFVDKWNTKQTIDVDFGYIDLGVESNQMGLF